MRQIEATDNSYVINALAKKMRGTPEWRPNNERILKDIIKTEFEQNTSLKDKLMNYKEEIQGIHQMSLLGFRDA